MPAASYERKAQLTEKSLQLAPVERLQEAACNVHYLLNDLSEFEAWKADTIRHWSVTPIHEAGHAVAYALAGREIREISFTPFVGPKATALGHVKLAGPRFVKGLELAQQLGANGLAREVVCGFAGPMAELRFDASRAYSGSRDDTEKAEAVCHLAQIFGYANSSELQEAAWREASMLMQHEGVWAAVAEIAGRLQRSEAEKPRVSGGAITQIVAKHVPTGWPWSGMFE